MKTLFSVGFQSHDPFTVQHPRLVGAQSLGHAIALRRTLGQQTSEFEHLAYETADLRAKLNSIIASGNKNLGAVRAWIAARINQDPTLVNSFGGDKVVAENFLSFVDMVTRDQYYADLAAQKIASNDPINYEFSDELLARVDEWSKGIDILSDGIQQYAVNRMVRQGPMGPVTQTIVNPRTGLPVTTTITPGSTIKTTTAPSSGISTTTLLWGGGIAAAAVAIILAMKA